MTSLRFILLAFVAFVLAFVAILWAAQGFPALTGPAAAIAGAVR